MKKMRKLIPAFALLLVSAIMLSTASYAWFSMSPDVSVNDMKIQAKADDGILISDEAGSAWAASAAAKNKGGLMLPGHTADDGVTWVCATSDNADDHTATSGFGDATMGTHYLKNTFYVKSSAGELDRGLVVKNVVLEGLNKDKALNNALRVLVVCDGTAVYFSSQGDTVTDKDGGTIGSTAAGQGLNADLGVSKIPAVSAGKGDGAIQIDVYVYFDGQHEDCRSNNLGDDLDEITVSLTFSLK